MAEVAGHVALERALDEGADRVHVRGRHLVSAARRAGLAAAAVS